MSANPIGRWYVRFLCPHCRKSLQFDGRTNLLGGIGSACFVAAGVSFIMAQPPYGTWIVGGAAAGWVVLTAMSYALRGIEKG